MQLNRNNFIRWYNSSTVADLSRVNLGSSGMCNPVPVWAVGDTMKVYFNHSSKAASTGTVSLINTAGSVVASNVGSLNSLTIVGGNHSYGTFTCPSVPNGFYRLKIGSLTTNLIRVVQSYPSNTMTVEFRHTGNLMSDSGSFIYKGNSITQRFTLPIISHEYDFDNMREVYEESTTRNVRASNQRTKKWVKFKLDYLDDDSVEALASMLTHNTITINGVSMVAKDGAFLEKEYDPLEKLNHWYFTMYEKSATLSSIA